MKSDVTIIDKLFLDIQSYLYRPMSSCDLSQVTSDLQHCRKITEIRPISRFAKRQTADTGATPQTVFLSRYSHHRFDNAKVIDNGAQPEIADGALCLAVYRISGRWMVVLEAGRLAGGNFDSDERVNIHEISRDT